MTTVDLSAPLPAIQDGAAPAYPKLYEQRMTLAHLVQVLAALPDDQRREVIGQALGLDDGEALESLLSARASIKVFREAAESAIDRANEAKARADRAEQRVRELESTDALRNMTMQRDVMCDKLNEYIDKTVAAERVSRGLRVELASARDALALCDAALTAAGVDGEDAWTLPQSIEALGKENARLRERVAKLETALADMVRCADEREKADPEGYGVRGSD